MNCLGNFASEEFKNEIRAEKKKEMNDKIQENEKEKSKNKYEKERDSVCGGGSNKKKFWGVQKERGVCDEMKVKECDKKEIKEDETNQEKNIEGKTIKKEYETKENKIGSHHNKRNSDTFNDIKGIYGFKNAGNNCYLNSSLQLLTRVKGLKDGILNGTIKNQNNAKEGNILYEFKKILEDIELNKKIIIPDYLKHEMGKIDDRYNYNRQEDANEFISNFLDALYKETSQNKYTIENFYYKDSLEKEAFDKFKIKFYDRKGYSKLNDIFYGIYITEKYCGCRKISVKFNAFNMIELPIYKFNNDKGDYATLDIKEILDSHFSKSKIYDSICENCHKDVYIKTSIYKLPENLIIFFGRTANGKYIPNKINYDETLKIEDYLFRPIDKKKYSLDCVIEHSGSSESGHYTAICKINPDNWYYFSDSFYHPIHSDFDSRDAIILLYKSK